MKSVAPGKCFQQSLGNNGSCDRRCPERRLTGKAFNGTWHGFDWQLTDIEDVQTDSYLQPLSPPVSQLLKSCSEYHCVILRCVIIQWEAADTVIIPQYFYTVIFCISITNNSPDRQTAVRCVLVENNSEGNVFTCLCKRVTRTFLIKRRLFWVLQT